jgi:hypothetical protein
MKKSFYPLNAKSLESEGVTTYKELWEKVQGEAKGFTMTVPAEFQKTYQDDTVTNKFHVIMSTPALDRHGEIVYQNWELEAYNENPVYLDSHNYGSIEHIIGKVTSVLVQNQKLEGDVEFALENPKGMLAFKLALGGFLNANSVGFIPLDFDEQGNITKSHLLELSAVSVPANAEALFEKGIDMEVVEMKDGRVLSKRNLEKLRTAHEAIGDVIKAANYEDDEEEKEEDEPEEEEKTIEVKSLTPDTYMVMLRHLKAKTDKQNVVLRDVARILQETRPQTLAERKREIYQKIRQAKILGIK